MFTTTPKTTRYQSGNATVTKSTQHADMWIISSPDGKFHTLSGSEESIKRIYPVTAHEHKSEGYNHVFDAIRYFSKHLN